VVIDLQLRDSWDKVFRALETQAKWPTLAEQLGREIRAAADTPARVRAEWLQMGMLSFLAAETGVPLDRDTLGQKLAATFDAALASLRLLEHWTRLALVHDQTISETVDLQALLVEVEAMRAEALDNWPWTPTKEEWEEGVADFERGDSLPADEAFAEIAGTDKESWLRRVEEYKQRRG